MRTLYTHPCASCGTDTFNFDPRSNKDYTEYHWVCDHCGIEMKCSFASGGREVMQTPSGRRCERTLVLLTFGSQLAIIHQGCRWSHITDCNVQYYYEEHTCPSNIAECREVIVAGKDDPHGCFTLIREIDITGPGAMSADAAMAVLVEEGKRLTAVILKPQKRITDG